MINLTSPIFKPRWAAKKQLSAAFRSIPAGLNGIMEFNGSTDGKIKHWGRSMGSNMSPSWSQNTATVFCSLWGSKVTHFFHVQTASFLKLWQRLVMAYPYRSLCGPVGTSRIPIITAPGWKDSHLTPFYHSKSSTRPALTGKSSCLSHSDDIG